MKAHGNKVKWILGLELLMNETHSIDRQVLPQW